MSIVLRSFFMNHIVFIFADIQLDSWQLRAESGALTPDMPTLDAGHFPCARCPRKMLIYSTTNKFICLSYDLSNLFNNEHFYGASFILLLLWTTSIQGRNSIYPCIILASSSHAPGLSCITLCWPMRWLESLCKLCTVQLRPRTYLIVHDFFKQICDHTDHMDKIHFSKFTFQSSLFEIHFLKFTF